MRSTLANVLLLTTLVYAIVAPASLAQVPAPCPLEDRPAVGRLRAIIEGVRQPDLEKLRGIVDGMWSDKTEHREARDRAIVALSRLALQGSGFQELRVCTPLPNLAVAGLRNDVTDAADQIVVEVDGSPDARASRIVVSPSVRSLTNSPSGASETERVDALRAYVDRLAAHGAFSGVVLIGHQGKTLFAQAWGESNRETHTPVTLDTPFNLASLSKIMTAVAVLQLVESGSLSLDTNVASILATSSNDPRFKQILVKHLLSHTSGLNQDPDALAFAPGTGFLYSNLGFRLLGEIVAIRSGMRFEDYMRLKIFGVAGMASTGRYELSALSPLLTFGYTLEPLGESDHGRAVPTWQVNPYLQTISGGGMGGLYSTAPDVLRFGTALLAGRFVSAATVETMKTPKPELGAAAYGFGVMRERTPGVWGHGGDLPGADAALEFYKDDYVAVVLANIDNVSAPILRTTRALFHSPS
jgi:CubicO group peptidase (beta-lactamase class C family)